jgi:hypothetical protein
MHINAGVIIFKGCYGQGKPRRLKAAAFVIPEKLLAHRNRVRVLAKIRGTKMDDMLVPIHIPMPELLNLSNEQQRATLALPDTAAADNHNGGTLKGQTVLTPIKVEKK